MNIKNTLGLNIEFLENGSIKSIQADPIRIGLKTTTAYSKPGATIYLRKKAQPFEFVSLFGAENSRFSKVSEDAIVSVGSWKEIDFRCTLRLSQKSNSWQITVDIVNSSESQAELDLIYVQDVGLKPVNSGLINEYYVSQYLERRVLEDKKFGAVVCCRQNMKEAGGHPWLMLACKNGAITGSTDGMQFYGKTCRETGIPEGLLTDRLQGEYAGESPVVALQEQPFRLIAGEMHQSVFVAHFLPDHPLATSEKDLMHLPEIIAEFENEVTFPDPVEWLVPTRNLFNKTTFLPAENLNEEELTTFFGKERRHQEQENGQLLSFFSNKNNHVVLKAKETLADRPHGHIMQAKAGLVPDENIVSTTAFMFGVFNSHLTQGNTNFNTLLSVCTSQFNLSPESGQRIFVQINGIYYLLGIPSAFEMGLNHCRWIYKHGLHCFQVRTWTSKTTPQVNLDFKVISGCDLELLITHDFDELNGWKVTHGKTADEFVILPKQGSMITGRFPDAQFRIIVQSNRTDYEVINDEKSFSGQKSYPGNLFTLKVKQTSEFCLSFLGEVNSTSNLINIENADKQWLSDCQEARTAWQEMSSNLSLESQHEDIRAISEILPWYGMNAITHFLTPYGLEQFSGAAWGTRDVSQGPLELLLTLGKYAEAKEVLRIIFSNQNTDGGWPQWWMFDSYAEIRAHDSHGDVVYWCIIALSNYIKVTGDVSILSEQLPYFNSQEVTPLSEHMERLLGMITGSFIPNTAFVPFGGGDWNDSLQPVNKELAERLISSWTVEMNYQAFTEYRQVYAKTGQHKKEKELAATCDIIKSDFNKYLVKDGVVAGYGLVENDGTISVLLHPRDKTTGISYSILPIERGILSGIFSKEQAVKHQELIEQHLTGPDGARLMDRPLTYKGGIQTIFQRAESSTFFGREIGLMYIHEHIRYAESLALTGNADAFVKALRQAIPVGYRDIVPCGDIRQANCYYSSSDVAFSNRYEADERYNEIKTGNFTLRGGWRVYSSGPGIYIGIVITRLLGLRIEADQVILDPVIPKSFDGFSASMNFLGYPITFIYRIKEHCFNPKVIMINGKTAAFELEENKYRKGGAVLQLEQFKTMLDQKENIVEIVL
ncbi:MAG: hypothetical protein IH598_10945 [Bacteroidales bacterium]|nr:hypothetical protein [Bacteroidales bacterium]